MPLGVAVSNFAKFPFLLPRHKTADADSFKITAHLSRDINVAAFFFSNDDTEKVNLILVNFSPGMSTLVYIFALYLLPVSQIPHILSLKCLFGGPV